MEKIREELVDGNKVKFFRERLEGLGWRTFTIMYSRQGVAMSEGYIPDMTEKWKLPKLEEKGK